MAFTVAFTVALFVLSGLVSPVVHAQHQFDIYAVASIPVGNFANGSNVQSGFATAGAGGMLSYTRSMSRPKGLGWVTSIAFFRNPSDRFGLIDTGSWLNIPFTTGMSYQTPVSRHIAVYGIAQLGINRVKPPDVVTPEAEAISEVSWSLGMSAGVGVLFNDIAHIRVQLMSLGQPEVTYAGVRNAPVRISVAQFIVGYRLVNTAAD